MKLDLSAVRQLENARQDFQYELDLSEYEQGGVRPVSKPVTVRGTVRNTAGMLELDAVMSTVLSLVCDRCCTEFKRDKKLDVYCVLARSSEYEGRTPGDHVFVCDGDTAELDDIFVPAFVLDMDMKVLCSDDCKGLCPRCGKNLNQGPCDCKPEADPRWDALKKLLDS